LIQLIKRKKPDYSLQFNELIPYVINSNLEKINLLSFDPVLCKVELELYPPAQIFPSENYFSGWNIGFGSSLDSNTKTIKINKNKLSSQVVLIDLPYKSISFIHINPLMFNTLNYAVRVRSEIKLIEGNTYRINKELQCNLST